MKFEINLGDKVELRNEEIVQNFYFRNQRIHKIPGSVRYNNTALPTSVRWTERYYGKRADGTFVKYAFCYANGNVYMGNDVAGTFSTVKEGLYIDAMPESVVVQVAGNSRMYLFDGYNTPFYYEGDSLGTFYPSAITYKFAQGVVKDTRLWAFERNSSTLYFSRPLYPEDFSATYGGSLIVGNEKDSFIYRILLIGNDIFVFKNDSIWVVRGNTKSTYSCEYVIPNMGVCGQRAVGLIGSSIIFVCEQDKEIYEFTGTPTPRQLSIWLKFAKRLDNYHASDIVCGWDMKNKLCRISFNYIDSADIGNNHEIIFPLDEFNSNGQPKWSMTKGARISCYSNWNRQNDNEFVTGRSDLGYLMYHNRGFNWDDASIECILRTDDISPFPGSNCHFNSLFIRGERSNGTVTIRTYLNTRHTGSASQDITDVGEQQTLGAISLSTQYNFNNYIPFLTGYDIGESMAFEVYDNTAQKSIVLEDLIIDYTRRDRVLNDLIG